MAREKDRGMFIDKIIGFESDPILSEKLHLLEHRGALEIIDVSVEDAKRRRMRLKSRTGNSFFLTLPRDTKLSNGAVLVLNDCLAVVVRVNCGFKLRVTPSDISSALRLGYFCGNLHWRAEFKNSVIEIAMDDALEVYLKRLEDIKGFANFKTERLDQ